MGNPFYLQEVPVDALGSVGGVQHSSKKLEELDLIERDEETGGWRPVDPILAIWLRMQLEEKLSQ